MDDPECERLEIGGSTSGSRRWDSWRQQCGHMLVGAGMIGLGMILGVVLGYGLEFMFPSKPWGKEQGRILLIGYIMM